MNQQLNHQFVQSCLNALVNIVNNNNFPIEFKQAILNGHDLRNNNQQTFQAALNLQNWVERAAVTTTGKAQVNNDMLGQFVGNYVQTSFNEWAAEMQRRQQSGMMGGGMSPAFGMMGGFNQPPVMQSLNREATGAQPMQTQQTPQPAPKPLAQGYVPPKAEEKKDTYITTNPQGNPFDAVEEKLNFNRVEGAANWGLPEPKDNVIALIKHQLLKAQESPEDIHEYVTMAQVYCHSPLEVFGHLMKQTPAQVFNQPVIIPVVYNHIERLDIATDDFVAFIAKVMDDYTAKNNNYRLFDLAMTALDDMKKGPHRAVTDYLLGRINRALYMNAGIASRPGLRFSLDALSDLTSITNGTAGLPGEFNTSHVRQRIISVVESAIANALTDHSTVMFTGDLPSDLDALRTSDVFPYRMDNVYPSKAAIPVSGTKEAEDLFSQLKEYDLRHHTYVRSVRMIVVTNLLSDITLGQIKKVPTEIMGQTPAILNAYGVAHADYRMRNQDLTKAFIPFSRNDNAASELKSYQDDSGGYSEDEEHSYAQLDTPELPVDLMIFALQYRKSPEDFVMAIDWTTSLDGNTNDYAFRVEFAKSKTRGYNLV